MNVKGTTTIIKCLLCIVLLNGCKSHTPTAPDFNQIKAYHKKTCSNNYPLINKDDLSLYVDYSICVSLGQHAPFFQALVPSWVSATRHYYSIKGSAIKEENNIDIYTELKNIEEVSYADLKRASELLAQSDSEGVLITDGEYFNQSIAKGNLTNPYMKNAFEMWLKKGRDIYIFAEPYEEIYRGAKYNKKRFYFIFSDSRIEGNIYERIKQTVELDKEFSNVQKFHLSSNSPRVITTNESSVINTTMSGSVEPYGDFETQDWPISWSSIEKFIIYGSDDEGNSLPNGQCVIGGMKIDKESYGGFKIDAIETKVYDINTSYYEFYNQVDSLSTADLECSNFIILDNEKFRNDGSIDLYFDAQYYNPSFLTGKPFNYFKIDISVLKCENIISNYSTMFNFDSIDSPGNQNVSVTESIKQCLVNPEIQNMMNSAHIYTIYVRSSKY